MSDQENARLFDEQVERWILEAIRRGVFRFDDLLVSLPSVYPSVLLAALNRLTDAQLIPERVLAEIQLSVTCTSLKAPVSSNGLADLDLPTPHPLDYEWRFSPDSIRLLMGECIKLSQPGEWIVLLGAPSLLRAIAIDATARQFALLDKNMTVVSHLARRVPTCRVQRFDAFRDDPPNLPAATVVLDPPWYESYFRAFLWTASKLCKVGSYVLLSLPPAGTRPGVLQERAEILSWSEQHGFTLVHLKPGTLPYISPPFECNALRVEGILNFPHDWRCGDLAVLKRVKGTEPPRPEAPSMEEEWTEHTIEEVRFRIRPPSSSGFGDSRLKSVVSGDVLPSVSRRDPRRKQVDVWTSGNRVYSCEGRLATLTILEALTTCVSPTEYVSHRFSRRLSSAERLAVLDTAYQIEAIVNIERNENERYNGT